ncbi:hypothetical protein Ciccas_008523 [Cichlidogyrus casuarinus]|uniref:C3H1-type domain-containing protein n=1 Tax=Cichlidogyrus casuarinus TaxID=1844966 RepID=A0ABD2PZN2_9PLAT
MALSTRTTSILDDTDRKLELLGWSSPLARHIISLIPKSILESPAEEPLCNADQGYQSPRALQSSGQFLQNQKTPLFQLHPKDSETDICLNTPNETFARRPSMKFDVQTQIGFTSYHIQDPVCATKILLSPIRSACLRCIREFTSPFNSKQNERNLHKLRDLLLILCLAIEDFRDTYGLLPTETHNGPIRSLETLTSDRFLPPIECQDLLAYLLVDKLSQEQINIEDQSQIDQVISVFQFAMMKPEEISEPEKAADKNYIKLTPSIPNGKQRTYSFLKDTYDIPFPGLGPVLSMPVSSSEDEACQILQHKAVTRKLKRPSKLAVLKVKDPQNNVRFKTELCSHYMRTGSCPKTSECHFAHGINELRTMTSHGKFRTRYCKNQDTCPFGDKCAFIHR